MDSYNVEFTVRQKSPLARRDFNKMKMNILRNFWKKNDNKFVRFLNSMQLTQRFSAIVCASNPSLDN